MFENDGRNNLTVNKLHDDAEIFVSDIDQDSYPDIVVAPYSAGVKLVLGTAADSIEIVKSSNSLIVQRTKVDRIPHIVASQIRRTTERLLDN